MSVRKGLKHMSTKEWKSVKCHNHKRQQPLNGSATSGSLKLNDNIVNGLPNDFKICKSSRSTVSGDLQQAKVYSPRNRTIIHGNILKFIRGRHFTGAFLEGKVVFLRMDLARTETQILCSFLQERKDFRQITWTNVSAIICYHVKCQKQ